MLGFLLAYLPTLALTLGLECLVALALATTRQRRRTILACLALNLLTHPLATLVLLHGNAPLVLLEVVIVGVEYVGYRSLVGMSAVHAVLLAVLANGGSAVLGMVLG